MEAEHDVYKMTRNMHAKGNATKLRYVPAKRVVNAIEYSTYNEANSEYSLTDDPTKWMV